MPRRGTRVSSSAPAHADRKPVITGLGLVTAWGSGPAAAWEALASGARPGREWPPEGAGASFFAAPIPDDYRRHDRIPANLAHFLDRGSRIALDAAFQALESAGIGEGDGDSRRFAVADGAAYRAPGQPTLFVPYGHLIARTTGTRGPVVVTGGGDASGMAAIATAARLVRDGQADVVIAGASQALQPQVLEHIAAQGWADAEPARPFDATSAGHTPAEAAAYVLVEAASTAAARGATILASIAGIGEVFDPSCEPLEYPGAPEAGRAMQGALAAAGYLQNQVDAVVSCADGRPAVDGAEGYGLLRTFGRHAHYASTTAPAGTLGHSFAASGAVGVAIALEMLRRQQVPPIGGFSSAVSELQLAFTTALKEEKLDCILVTATGVGGTLVSLLLER